MASRMRPRLNSTVRAAALVIASVAIGGVVPPAPPTGTTLVVFVDGVEGRGDVVVRLYPSSDGFPCDFYRTVREIRGAVGGRGATVVFDDVAPGRVAVVAFDDADRNGRVRYGADGAPLDGVSAPNWTGGPVRWSTSSFGPRRSTANLVRLRLRYPPRLQLGSARR